MSCLFVCRDPSICRFESCSRYEILIPLASVMSSWFDGILVMRYSGRRSSNAGCESGYSRARICCISKFWLRVVGHGVISILGQGIEALPLTAGIRPAVMGVIGTFIVQLFDTKRAGELLD